MDKKVLVIDDDAHIRRVIELKLKSKGFEVIMARNGEEGLSLVKCEWPSVVITDINMPKLDGRSLCDELEKLKKERPFQTIVVTNRVCPEDKKWIAELTDTILMGKPFSPSKLLSTVCEFFTEE